MPVGPASPRRPAATAALVVAAACAAVFGAALLLPLRQAAPRPDTLRIGDLVASGRVVALQWTGDGSRLVAITEQGDTRSAVALGRDGTRRAVAAPTSGELAVYAAPAGSRVALVRARTGRRTRVAVLDVREGNEIWYRYTDGPTTARWLADGSLVVRPRAGLCRVYAAGDGQLVPEPPSGACA
jgi:hypothetical protein